ncbi:DUF4865 family protein [Pyxidicoccus parkwayensis]|uniref:DUF4865 family protein n=1 Tax=Pyxidicoccus parkwayensis TaxID=2813578 RepID=A0ABX7NX08_9BACT|nr:DUF4865 family protein [Pyxidicoccus parkwaysis]QSQ22914.1 DUF4865 family protein [Pyxidicoccus parkwaysis]
MLAMQYSFALPADYDMAIIRNRIAIKGHLMDDFQGLGFKAFLYACRGDASHENLYAPFYVWRQVEGMNAFLGGEGFAALTQSFGWPSVRTALVLHASWLPSLKEARYATREVTSIAPHTSLAALREREVRAVDDDVTRDGALSAVTAYEPTTWTLVRFRLWREPRDVFGREGFQSYRVGHVSAPAAVGR